MEIDEFGRVYDEAFTIQNVPIKYRRLSYNGGSGYQFTIQNVPIKLEKVVEKYFDKKNLQYRMFLLNIGG